MKKILYDFFKIVACFSYTANTKNMINWTHVSLTNLDTSIRVTNV